MAIDSQGLRRYATAAMVVAVSALALAGIVAFVISMRPCRVKLLPGSVVDYRLTTECTEVPAAGGQAGVPQIHESRLTLVCIGQGNEIALVAPGVNAGTDDIALMSFAPDGTARLLSGEGPLEAGKALGYFDFNLLPLPVGHEQDWKVSVMYAALPADKRQQVGRARRTANAARPEFELKLPTIEWRNEAGRYVQLRGLTSTYRFDPTIGLVDRATVKCRTGIERDEKVGGSRYWQVVVRLELLGVQQGSGDVAALRDLALAGPTSDGRAQAWLDRLDRDPALRAVVARLRQPPAPWWLAVVNAPLARRADAEQLVARLQRANLPAGILVHGQQVIVRCGPYAAQDANLAAIVGRAAGRTPRWVQAP